MQRTSGTLQRMTKHEPDPTLDLIAAQFTRHDVAKAGKEYAILDRRTADTIARLRPIPDTDRFELFFWSNNQGSLDDVRQPRAHEAHARERP
jgi:hypothetical protein